MSDYIKREDAIKASTPAFRNAFSDWEVGWIESKDDTKDMIENLPSEDVAPVRHGRWVDVDRMQMHDLHGVLTWGNSFMCTECSFKTFAVEGHMSQYHYCPSCGARMDGDDNEID